MDRHRKTCRGNPCPGFTLIEALIVVVVIAIVASIAVPRIGGIHSQVRLAKLEKDVDTINEAIDVYLASGGDLGRLSKPQEILDRLKTVRQSETARQFVGLTGSTIDRRLAARMAGGGDQALPRAVWSGTEHRFVIEPSGTGVVEFYLDESLADRDYGEEARADSALTYNGDPGWVWAYKERAPEPPMAPDPPVEGAAVPESPLPAAAAPPVGLRAPAIAPGGGTYKPSQFPLTVTLTNPNDSSTWLMVSVNGGGFVKYAGPLTLTADSTIRTYVTGDPARWINSNTASAWFQKSAPAKLLPPAIRLSAPEFDDSTPTISISLTNPNAPGLANLHYAVVPTGGSLPPRSGWAPYGGTVTVSGNAYPSGFTIAAYARALDPVDYQDSDSSSASAGANFIFEDPGVTDVLYIIDVSGSMSTAVGTSTRLDLVISALADAINRLNAQARFSVAAFGGGIEWTDPSLELKEATAANKLAMISQVRTFTSSSSGTNYEAALRIPFLYARKPALVYFLTDGQPTGGGDYADEVDTLAAQGIRVNTIGVDLTLDAGERLAEIAAETKGKARAVKTQ